MGGFTAESIDPATRPPQAVDGDTEQRGVYYADVEGFSYEQIADITATRIGKVIRGCTEDAHNYVNRIPRLRPNSEFFTQTP